MIDIVMCGTLGLFMITVIIACFYGLKYLKYIVNKEINEDENLQIIKLQNERIDNLNHELCKYNVVIREDKPIKLNNDALDYMDKTEQELFVKRDIIHNSIEFIEMALETPDEDGLSQDDVKKLVKILKGE